MKMTMISVNVENKVVDKIDAVCAVNGNCSRSAVVRKAITFFLGTMSTETTGELDIDDNAVDADESKLTEKED